MNLLLCFSDKVGELSFLYSKGFMALYSKGFIAD